MFSCYFFLLVSFWISLPDFCVSTCNYNCADKPVFTPSTLLVKYGDPANATCVACKEACNGTFVGLETPVGKVKENTNTLLWTVDSLTEWDSDVTCFYDASEQCCSILAVTVYQPPENVTISFKNHTGPVFEDDQYTLQCSVLNVAPVQNLTVTFYRGQTALDHLQSNSGPEKKSVSETFTLNITASRGHDGAQYWCEAKLELESEGRQLHPVMKSEKLNTAVYYEPELQVPPNRDPIKITEGDTLHLNCSAIGNPSPSYTWTLPSNNSASYSDGILTIKSVGFEHEGEYNCSVSNNAGTVTMSLYVDVQVNYIPWIIIGICVLFVLLLLLAVFFYFNYYKQNKMGRYNLKDVFHLKTRHTAVPLEQ